MQLRDLVRPYRRPLAVVSVLSLVLAQLEAAALMSVAPLAKAVADGNRRTGGAFGPVEVDVTIDQLAALAIGLVLGAIVLNVIVAVVRSRLIAAAEADERDQILALYVRASLPTQQSVRDGRLLQLSNFAGKTAQILASIASVIRAGTSLVVFVIFALLVDWAAALAILVTGTVLTLALRPLARRVKAISAEASTLQLEYGQGLNETAANSRDLLVHGASEHRLAQLRGQSAALAALKRRAGTLSSLIGPSYQYTGILLVVLAIWWASSGAGVELAALGVIAILLLRSLSYARQLESGYRGIIENQPFVDRLAEARAQYEADQRPTGGTPLEAVHELSLEGVTYRYAPDAAPALDDLTVALRPGEVLGVVGPSGSGKSTLLQILLRLRVPDEGRLLVNRLPADQFSLASWYERITMVPQQTNLFHDTVAANIALRPDVPRERVEAAARAAGIHDVITELGDGYDTLVGPAFRDLSGGQIQRIGIARALVHDASVIVLDEPTSALDVHSEAQIQDTLRSLGGDVTLVIIAHRLSTLSICDRLLVLRDGRLDALGTLEEVHERSGFFRSALDAGTLDLQASGRG